MNEKMKAWIDNATYQQLLGHWRFAPSGDPFFQGEIGDYYVKKMAERRAEVGHDAHVTASKTLGWEK
jgi:hypothetical protein